MTQRTTAIWIVWILSATYTCAAEKPTREAISTYNDDCKAAGVQADFIAKFGDDFAGLDLHDIDFSGPHAVGMESNLRGANFRGANLRGAFFGAAVLERASFRDADLRDAKFVTANLQYVNLLGAQLDGASIRESNLSHVNAAEVSFAGVDISGSDFPFADLRKAKLAGAKNEYSWTDFTNANLASADLSSFTAYGAQFHEANLRGANFKNADIGFADFGNAELHGALFDGARLSLADFRHARGLSDAQRRELVRKSGIVEWERIRMVTSFLDAPWFPLLLVVVIPALVWLARRLTHRPASKASADAAAAVMEPTRFQFTLAGMLVAMFVVAAFVGVAMWSTTGFYSLAMVVSFYLMLHPVLYEPTRRLTAGKLLGAAVVYCAVIAVGTLLAYECDLFVMGIWSIFSIFIGPLLVMVAGTIWATSDSEFSGKATLGFIVWLIGVSFANLWIMATLFASV